ncbi:hypothetical protein JTB14_032741 [Gonioctena quinquepunctata]|nr:hypothetical protein JTB14_032741 [Gonioctena quinquepunctata]
MCQYSEDETMVKLWKSLRGETKSSVSAMMMTSKNLELIMKTLQMRVGRPELILDIILVEMSAIPHMKELNIDKLISFSDEVNNLVATMKSLDNYGHYYNPQLLEQFVNKLPDRLKLEWGEVVLLNHGRVNMEKFFLWISDIADAATYVTTPCKKYQGQIADIVLNAIRSEKSPKAGDKKSHSVNTCDKLKADDIDTRWVKTALAAAGVSTSEFRPHSTRHAATSKAHRSGVSMDVICKRSGWTNESTFGGSYHGSILNTSDFAKANLKL